MPAIALGIGGIVGSLGGAAIAAHGATSAANTQSQAALQAANLQHQDAQSALDFQKQQYGTAQTQLAPFLQSGYKGLANLQYLMGLLRPGGTSSSTPVGTQLPNGTTSVPGSIGDPNGGGSGPPQLLGARGRNENGDIMQPEGFQGSPGTTPADFGQGTGPLSVSSTNPNSPVDLSSLIDPSVGGFGSLLQPFSAPDLNNTTDPGYLSRLKMGTDVLQNSAAAKGNLLTGGTLKNLDQFTQDYASNEYGKVYDRAFNTFENNNTNTFNRLASLAGLGQQATNTSISSGQNSANNISNILLSSGSQIGGDIQNAGAARATGYQNAGNLYGSALSGIPSNLMNLYFLSQMTGGGGMTPSQMPGAPVYATGG